MGKLLKMIPARDLKQEVTKVLRQLKKSREPFVITQGGRAAAVLLSVETYERSEHDHELLRLFAKGEREIQAGKGYDLDSVLAEIDAILAEDPS